MINSPCWSHRLNKSLALVHLQPRAAQPGSRLQVVSDAFNGSATVEATPFFDPAQIAYARLRLVDDARFRYDVGNAVASLPNATAARLRLF